MALRLPWFLSGEPDVLALFDAQVEETVRGMESFAAWAASGSEEDAVAVRHAEHAADEARRRLMEVLRKALVTPLDPEEISRLASALDEVLDYIDGATEKMYYYGIDGTDAHMIELAKLIHMSTAEIESAVKGIRSIKDPKYIEERCIEVNRLENLADDVLAHAVTDLFKTTDAIAIIKLKDIYEHLETATDHCEDVANVLSDIAIRHS